MKLFISWSGEFSRKVAECLSIWIPTIIQTVDVFYSPNDIAKGENWSSRLSDELEQSNFGIVCLTSENVLAPWIHFEAGALSKVANSRVSAIMLGISPSDVKGPLARFQNTAVTREDFYRLFQSINNSHETPLKQAVLDHAFDNSWEKLGRDIATLIKKYSSLPPAPKEAKPDRRGNVDDAIQEILSIVRTLGNNRTPPQESPAFEAFNAAYPKKARGNSFQTTALISCPRGSIDNVLPILYRYSRNSPEAKRPYKDSLHIKEQCAVLIDIDQAPALATELQEFGATMRLCK